MSREKISRTPQNQDNIKVRVTSLLKEGNVQTFHDTIQALQYEGFTESDVKFLINTMIENGELQASKEPANGFLNQTQSMR